MAHISNWNVNYKKVPSFKWNYQNKHKVKLWKKGKAGILTSGGNCPGINYTVKELNKEINQPLIFFKDGYSGLNDDVKTKPNGNVSDNGSVLGMSRVPLVPEKAVKTCLDNNISNLYIIGGNGTCNGAFMLQKYIEINHLPIVLNVIPKTIDNDIYGVSKSFGFDSTVEHCAEMIDKAYIEAKTNSEISLIELMGNKCGKLAMMSSFVSDNVDLLLIPEDKISYAKIIDKIEETYSRKQHMVIVVSEGYDILEEKNKMSSIDKIEHGIKTLEISHKPKVFKPNYLCRNAKLLSTDKIYIKKLVKHVVDAGEQGFGGYTISKEGKSFFMIPLENVYNKECRISRNDYVYQNYYLKCFK